MSTPSAERIEAAARVLQRQWSTDDATDDEATWEELDPVDREWWLKWVAPAIAAAAVPNPLAAPLADALREVLSHYETAGNIEGCYDWAKEVLAAYEIAKSERGEGTQP